MSVLNVSRQAATDIKKLDSKDLELALKYAAATICNSYPKCVVQDENVLKCIGYLRKIFIWYYNAKNDRDIELEKIGFSKDLVDQIGSHVLKMNSSIKESAINFRLSWRIDISLCNSTIKNMPPRILLCFELDKTSNKKVVVEMDIAQFHKLRFHISYLLREMNLLNASLNKKKFINTSIASS